MIGWIAVALLLAACSRQAETPYTETAVQPPVIQTVEVEVTRVVYRETLVTPTPTIAAPCSPQSIGEASEIVVGALLPLSSPGVWMRSANMQSGLNLALEHLNGAGVSGVPVRLAIRDTGDDPVRSAQAAEQLITEECAIGLIVGLGDAATQAAADVAERYRKPALVIDATSPQITAGRPQATFRLAPALPMIAATPANWLANVGDYNGDGTVQAVIIADNSTYGETFVSQSEELFAQAGIGVETHRVDSPTTDFSPEIARLLAMQTIPDAVFIAIGSDSGLDLQKQLFDAGIRPDKGTLVVNQYRRALDPAAFFQRSQPDAGSIVARRGPWPSTASDSGRHLFERYRQSGLQPPEFSTFLAHDALWLLADAVQRASSLRGEELIKALESSDVELAAGRYSFPYGSAQLPNGDTVPDYAWHQWMTPPLLYLMYTEPDQDPAALPVIWPEAYRSPDAPALSWK